METYTPIALLKQKLDELKSIPGTEPNMITEYEKAILILELIGSNALDDKANEAQATNRLDSNPNTPGEQPKPYYERFMEAQKNKQFKSKKKE